MAQTIMCDSDDGMTADVMISQIANGDTIALCGGCLPQWCKGITDALLPPEEPKAPAKRANQRAKPKDDKRQTIPGIKDDGVPDPLYAGLEEIPADLVTESAE